MSSARRLTVSFCALGLCCALTSTASALTAEVAPVDAAVPGQAVTFQVTAKDAVGTAQYRWSFGDDMQTDFSDTLAQVQHTYDKPGHYSVLVNVKDSQGGTGVPFQFTVHYPLTAKRPALSTDILYDAAHERVVSVNEDNDSITVVDAKSLKKVAELPVYNRPVALALAPNGKLWVLHRDDYAVAVVDLDQMHVDTGFRLPYASQPVGLVMSPMGDAAYVTLFATGKLLKLNPTTGAVVAELDVGPTPRGVSVSADGKDVYVTRFLSSLTQGEIAHVSGQSFKLVDRFALAPDTTTSDTDQSGRGLPNYLFAVALSPDARQAWVSSKKDDIFRGAVTDKLPLTQDNTVRPQVTVLDLSLGPTQPAVRQDLDDRNLPTHIEWSPLGDYGFISCTGSNLVEVRDAYSFALITDITDAGLGPRGSVLSPDNRLFVNGTLGREIVVFDVSDIVARGNKTAPPLARIPAVDKEKLPPDVLLGKQIFTNSADGRMTFQGYLSCATCHFEGFEDGRVWDFTSQGEGLRNTPSLLGRRGNGEGRMLWSGSLDEVQDFEHQIRTLFGGKGFVADDVLAQGTRSDPLGQPLAGASKELDALAAYAKTLEHVDRSPYRNPDGSMTAQAEAGEAVFAKLGCDFCHSGPDATDSSRGLVHDVGTLKPSSGMRANGPLLGIDTPTLLGVWETAPYLHDGSAATLKDVLTTANPEDKHGFVSSLSAAEVDQLVRYLQELDSGLPIHRLAFEPEPAAGGAAGVGGAPSGGTGPNAGYAGAEAGSTTGGSGGQTPASTARTPAHSACACATPGVQAPSMWGALSGVLAAWSCRARRRHRKRELGS